jgi:hypothetical protein
VIGAKRRTGTDGHLLHSNRAAALGRSLMLQ